MTTGSTTVSMAGSLDRSTTGSAPGSLVELQEWMLDAIVSPASPEGWEGRIATTTPWSGRERIESYRRGYRQRLVECLREMHPALRHALGDDVFDAFVLDYLASRPSRSYTLFRLGEAFSHHLSGTRPSGESWPDFVLGVIAFEQLFLEVYDGEGPEGMPVAGPDRIAAAGDAATVVGVPGLRLFHCPYPVAGYVMAVRRGDRPPLPRPEAIWLAVFRREFVVTTVALDHASYAVLELLVAGTPAGEAADRVGLDRQVVRGWLEGWAAQGLFREIVDTAPSRKECP